MMKKIIALFTLSLMLFSCNKDINKLEKDITGTWEIEKTVNYSGTINYPAGNGNTIVLSSTGDFERFENAISVFKGSYSLKQKKDCGDREDDILFTSTEPNSTGLYVSIENGKLIFNTSNCYADGNIASYIRL